MSHISDHQAEAFDRIITQYRFDVKLGKNPMELDPTGAFATRRLEGCSSTFIMRLHRNSDDVLIDVYDFQQNGNAYKTTADGAWVDMTGDTYFVDTWYNQSVPGNDVSQSTKAKKPTLVASQRNGWPVVRWDGTDDWLLSDKSTNEFITPSEGVMMAGYKPTGTPPTVAIPNPYLCQAIVADYDAFAPLTRGICTPYGPNDSLFADMYSTTEYAVPMEVLAGNWYNGVWKLNAGILYGYKNGALAGTENAGVVSSDLSAVLVMGHYPWQGGTYLEGDLDQVYTFDENVSEQDIYDIHLFMANGGDTDINNIKKIMKSLVEQVQDIEDLTQPFFDRLDIATQVGAQLDGIGEIVGQAREYFTDAIYRQLLYLKIVRNLSEGTPEELIEIFDTMTNPDLVQFQEQYPAAFTLTAINPSYLFDYPYIWEAIQKAKAAGVGINGLIEAFETVFAFLDDTVGSTDGFADVVPPGTPTVGGVFASMMPDEFITALNPITASATGVYSTRRLDGCQSSHIMRVYRVTAADEVDIYEVQNGTSNYRLTEGGAWVDGSSETFNVITLYDQTGSGRTFDAPTSANRGQLVFNERNGWPVIRGDGTNHWYESDTFADEFWDADKATVMIVARPDDSFVSANEAWKLGNLYQDSGSWYALSVGTLTTISETKMFAYNWRLTPSQEDYIGTDFVDGEFSTIAWVYGSPILYFYKSTETASNMSLVGQTETQNYLYGIAGFTHGLFGHGVPSGTAHFKGDISDLVLFDSAVAQSVLTRVNKYLMEN